MRANFDLVEQAVELLLGERRLENRSHGHHGKSLEARPGGRRQVGGRGQDEVDLLGDDVGDRLAAQRGIEDVRRDLGVERDGQGLGRGIVGKPGDEQRLDLVADERRLGVGEERAKTADVIFAGNRDDTPVRTGDRHPERGPLSRPRVVEQERDADRGLGRDPLPCRVDFRALDAADPARVCDCRSQGHARVARRQRIRRPGRRAVAIGRGVAHRLEVEAQLETAALGQDVLTGAGASGRRSSIARTPALGSAGNPGGRK